MLKKYRVVSPVIRAQKKGLLQLLLLAVISAFIAALMPWPIKLLVDYALADTTIFSTEDFWSSPVFLIAAAGVLSIILYISSSALGVASSWLWSKIGQQMVIDLSMNMFNQLQRLSRKFHIKHPVADSLGRLTIDSWCVFTIAQSLLITPSQNLITLIIIGAFAWILDPYLTVISLLIAPVIAGTSIFFGERLRNRAQQNRQAQSSVMAFAHQTVNSVPLVQAFTLEKRNAQRYQTLSDAAVRSAKQNSLLDNGFTLVNAIGLSIGLTVVLVIGSLRVTEGIITVGSLLVFLGYLQTLQAEMESLLLTYKNLKSTEANLDRVLEVFEADEVIHRDVVAGSISPATSTLAPSITFKDICFSYKEETPVLKNINLSIKAGETVAFVGGSGSGKSTLASLIPRFFNWDSGDILIDGQNILDIELSQLRDQVSVVLQDPFLLPVTVAENISYGCSTAPRDAIIKAATTASASAFIKKLPKGYDTVLGERGSNLSGGQKQRLAIARAILKNAPILILDEPTSALDARTETLFFEALSKLMHGKTTIIVAHRLQTIRDADKIVVIEQGEIAEIGTHKELIDLNGIYADMIRIQSDDENTKVAA